MRKCWQTLWLVVVITENDVYGEFSMSLLQSELFNCRVRAKLFENTLSAVVNIY